MTGWWRSRFSRSEAGADPGFAERFTREARALARLSHPNIVAIYDFGHVNGLHYFIMEFVDGLNLRQLEQAGRLSPREALQIIPQICEALQFAHDEGIVHRDIKPENVLLDKKGRVKIADFGLARILGHEPEDFRLTRAREVMGTPHYMAPEQVEKPQSVDHRADIYSLGVVFYEMLTGELPLGKFAPPSQKVQIDVRLDEVVLRALEKEPARRYQQASEVKTDMETIMTQQPALTVGTPSAPPGPQSSLARLLRLMVIVLATGVVVSLGISLIWSWWLGPLVGARKSATPSLTAGLSTNLSVVAKPGESNRWYYVSGEVRSPGRWPYEGRITLLQAIASAGDFTDLASKRNVQLRHADGRSQSVNCSKAVSDPTLDLEVQPGDTIFVKRRLEFGTGPAASPGTNAGSAQAASEAFAQRYGLAPPAVVVPRPETGSLQDASAAFEQRYGLRGSSPTQAPSPVGTNANGGVAASGTPPLAYEWRFDANATNGATTPGPEGLAITKLMPLSLRLTLDSVVVSDAEPRYRYVIGIQKEAALASPGSDQEAGVLQGRR